MLSDVYSRQMVRCSCVVKWIGSKYFEEIWIDSLVYNGKVLNLVIYMMLLYGGTSP